MESKPKGAKLRFEMKQVRVTEEVEIQRRTILIDQAEILDERRPAPVRLQARLETGEALGELDVQGVSLRCLKDEQARTAIAERYTSDVDLISKQSEIGR